MGESLALRKTVHGLHDRCASLEEERARLQERLHTHTLAIKLSLAEPDATLRRFNSQAAPSARCS